MLMYSSVCRIVRDCNQDKVQHFIPFGKVSMEAVDKTSEMLIKISKDSLFLNSWFFEALNSVLLFVMR